MFLGKQEKNILYHKEYCDLRGYRLLTAEWGGAEDADCSVEWEGGVGGGTRKERDEEHIVSNVGRIYGLFWGAQNYFN